MAHYKIQGPDGKEHVLEGPDGATDAQIIAAAQDAFGHNGVSASAQAALDADKKGLQDVSVNDTIAAPFMAADAAGEMTATSLGRSGHPLAGAVVGTGVQMAPYIPAAVSGIKSAGAIGDSVMSGVQNTRQALSDWFKKKAEEQAMKAAAPTPVNLEQIGDAMHSGAEGVRQSGRYLLDKKIVTPGTSPEEMLQRIEPLNKAAGQGIGALRDSGDLRSLAQGADRPTSLQMEKEISDRLTQQYTSGAEADQSGQLKNALDEVRKLAPVEHSTTGAEMAQTMENTGLESKPYYYPEKMEAADAYQSARASQEALPEMTDGFPYLHDKPTFSELADKATRLNTVAKNARTLNQPSGALTDAANILSEKSTAGLEKFLTPEEGTQLQGLNAEFGMTSRLKSIMDRGQYRELASGGNGIPVSHFGAFSRGVNMVAPASTRATMADKISRALQTNPQVFGRNGQVLQRALQTGKASLNSTIYMLQQQSPEFKEQYEKMNREGQ